MVDGFVQDRPRLPLSCPDQTFGGSRENTVLLRARYWSLDSASDDPLYLDVLRPIAVLTSLPAAGQSVATHEPPAGADSNLFRALVQKITKGWRPFPATNALMQVSSRSTLARW